MESAKMVFGRYNVTISRLFAIIIDLDQDKQITLLRHAKNLSDADRRTFVRKSCRISVKFATSEMVHSGVITDISHRGLFIHTRAPIYIGEKVIMNFHLGKTFVDARGEIIHANRFGIGVEFKRLTVEVKKAIRKFVADKSETLPNKE
jgi:hypothetical protein